MNTEEMAREEKERPLNFDAHEFDGLRDALEKEAQGIFTRVDQFIRDNPWLCIGIAAAAGLAVACAVRKGSSTSTPEDVADKVGSAL
jgi:ElaB/YqjD/DUF883 family membrane-anchored ribosome-binding protein